MRRRRTRRSRRPGGSSPITSTMPRRSSLRHEGRHMSKPRKSASAREGPIKDLSWEEPPRPKAVYDWEHIARNLRARPIERPNVFKNGRTSVVIALRQGAVGPMHPDLGFQFRTTNNIREPVRMCDLYARFNPDLVKSSLRESIRSTRKKA